jgi:DNA-binding NarL/FixJ family response regulator
MVNAIKLFKIGKGVPSVDLLTTREREVLKLVSEGNTSPQIAALLYISVRTVQHHRNNMMVKLGLDNTVDLIRYAMSKGYTNLP